MYIFKQKKPLSIYCLISVAEVVQMKSSESEAKTASSGFQGGLILVDELVLGFFSLGVLQGQRGPYRGACRHSKSTLFLFKNRLHRYKLLGNVTLELSFKVCSL